MPQDRLDAMCSVHLRFRDLIECGETWARLADAIDNRPREEATWDALARLAQRVLDPVIDHFGPIILTYGFASASLARHIPGRIAPSLDQHAGHERRNDGRPLCPRLGQAADLRVEGTPSRTVGRWIMEHTPFDRLYFYGEDRPLHVSVGPDESRAIVEMRVGPSGRHVPRAVRSL